VCAAFKVQAMRWLATIQAVLTQQDSASAWLDPRDEAVSGSVQAC
jgi:hypothetical protein